MALPISASRLQQDNAINRSSTSLITPQLSALADPAPTLIDANLFDYLLQEVIKLIISSEEASREKRIQLEKQVEQELKLSHNTPRPSATAPTVPSKTNAANSTSAQLQARDEADQGVRTRLDKMGYKVGWALVEKLARDRLRFPTTPAPSSAPATSTTTPVGTSSTLPSAPIPDPLETVKFICKDLWILLYDKQIDNLRTNHRGVYVLHDNAFKPLARLSGNVGQASEVNRRVKFFLSFPSGIIRGALANLGVPCTVTAESAGIPQCTFQIKTVRSGA